MNRLTPIRLALLQEDRTQKWLADQIGKDPSVVSRIVNGLHPDEETRALIARALRRDVGELWPTTTPETEIAA